jgi:hypothetical protein
MDDMDAAYSDSPERSSMTTGGFTATTDFTSSTIKRPYFISRGGKPAIEYITGVGGAICIDLSCHREGVGGRRRVAEGQEELELSQRYRWRPEHFQLGQNQALVWSKARIYLAYFSLSAYFTP